MIKIRLALDPSLILSLILALLLGACSHMGVVRDLPSAMNRGQDGYVIDTTPALAMDILKQSLAKTVLIEFVTNWCHVCKELKAPVRKLAADGSGRFIVIRIDVTHDDEALRSFGMNTSYPGFKLIAPGLEAPIVKYGSGSFEDLSAWLLAKHEKDLRVPLDFSTLVPSTAPKAVLVAGSAQNANFAQEIVWMASILREKGLKSEEIACFYAKPDAVQYFSDKEQFDLLAPQLRGCHVAERGEILRTIQKALVSYPTPSNFFFYASSHGAPPAPEKMSREQLKCYAHAPSLVLDNGDNECDSLNHLTPEAVASIVPEDPAVKKIMVFQGCYSGGFISNNDNVKEFPSALAKLPNVALFTASQSDRPSFGCSSGDVATFYGVAFIKSLMEDKHKLDEIDWAQVNKGAQILTRDMEDKLHVRYGSGPQFFLAP